MSIKDKTKKLEIWMKDFEKKYSTKNLPEEDELLDQFLHYLIFYGNPAQSARRAFKALKNEHEFSDWNEVRMATVNEINDAISPAKVSASLWLSRIIKGILEGVWKILNEMSLKKLRDEKVTKARDLILQIEDKASECMYGEHEERRGEEPISAVIPPWATSYLLTWLGHDSAVPWDPYTHYMAETELGLVDASQNLVRRKKQLRALVKTDADAIRLHHLFVEYGKRNNLEKVVPPPEPAPRRKLPKKKVEEGENGTEPMDPADSHRSGSRRSSKRSAAVLDERSASSRSKSSSSKSSSAKSATGKASSSKASPSKASPSKASSSKASPSKASPSKGATSKSSTAKSSTSKSRSSKRNAKPGDTKSSPSKRKSAKKS